MSFSNYETWEPFIHAFVEVSQTQAAGKDGVLSGLSVGVKDIIDVAGMKTRNGSATCENNAPAYEDAVTVAALRNAGAHIFGKTVTTEFAFTDPTLCRNPHDVMRSPGGSSSGSGAAVAAGVIDFALGSQTAGSLCRPAAYCGAVGFKPSFGVLSTQGMTPLAPSFDTVGIVARSTAVASKVFFAMSPQAGSSAEPSIAGKAALCGIWEGDIEPAPADDTLAALDAAFGVAKTLGANIKRMDLSVDVARVVAAHRLVMNSEAATQFGEMLNDGRADMLKPKFRSGLIAGAAISDAQLDEARDLLAKAKHAFWAQLGEVDFVLTLPVPDGAPMIDGTTGFQDWLTPWTVFGGPLICLPWGVDKLLRPVSVMLAARPFQDARLLQVAAALEAAGPTPVTPKIPQLSSVFEPDDRINLD